MRQRKRSSVQTKSLFCDINEAASYTDYTQKNGDRNIPKPRGTSLSSTPQPLAFRRRAQRRASAPDVARRQWSFVDHSVDFAVRDGRGRGQSRTGSVTGSSSRVGEGFVGEEDEGDVWRGSWDVADLSIGVRSDGLHFGVAE